MPLYDEDIAPPKPEKNPKMPVVYIKEIETDRGTAYALHNAEDGARLKVIQDSAQAAFLFAEQCEFKPEYVH